MTFSLNHSLANSETSPPPVDAIVQVSISSNQLNAYIYIKPPENNGDPPSASQIVSALAQRGVTFGILEDVVSKIEQSPIYEQDILVAEGIAPVDGTNGTYELLFSTCKEGKPKERADGTVDFRDLELVQNVEQGQVLCTITLPSEGIAGTSVCGQSLAARNGKPVSSLLGKNTHLSADGMQVLASISGHVDFAVGKINVNDTLFIQENVDNSTGNIKTVSNVIIAGAVLPGFTVESEGSIQIGGTVSGSSIIAGGNIILKSGIISGHLQCNGNLTTKFIENAKVFVKGCINCDYIMNGDIKCAKSITVGGSIAKIVGGSCMAGENIKARIIGSSSGTKTYLEIGTDPAMMLRQQELIKSIPQLESKINSLQSLINLLQQFEAANRLTPDKKQALQDALYSHQTCSTLLQNEKQELIDINNAVKKKGYGRVICTDTICPGTTVKIGTFKMDVQTPIMSTALYYTDDGISQTPTT